MKFFLSDTEIEEGQKSRGINIKFHDDSTPASLSEGVRESTSPEFLRTDIPGMLYKSVCLCEGVRETDSPEFLRTGLPGMLYKSVCLRG